MSNSRHIRSIDSNETVQKNETLEYIPNVKKLQRLYTKVSDFEKWARDKSDPILDTVVRKDINVLKETLNLTLSVWQRLIEARKSNESLPEISPNLTLKIPILAEKVNRLVYKLFGYLVLFDRNGNTEAVRIKRDLSEDTDILSQALEQLKRLNRKIKTKNLWYRNSLN